MVSLLIVLSILMAISWLGWRLVMVEQQRHPANRERLVKRLGHRRRQRSSVKARLNSVDS